MEPQIVFGRWVKIEGDFTEYVDADLIGDIEPYQGLSIPVPESLADYCENRTVTEIKVIEGYGARFHHHEEPFMPFMEPQIVFGRWVEVDGNIGTEFIDADLIGNIEPYQGLSIPVPESIT